LISSLILITAIDPPQLIYSLSSLLFIFILNLIYYGYGLFIKNKVHYLYFLLIIITVLGTLTLFLFKYEMFNGVVGFLSTMNAMAVYSQVPRDVSVALENLVSINTIWLIVPLILFSI
jgi:hypothetical protein